MAYLDLLIHTSDTTPYKEDRTRWTPEMVRYDKESNVKQGYLAAVLVALGVGWN